MHVSEAAVPLHHSRNDPVKTSATDGQAESQNATPQFHVPASVISSPALPDTIALNVASADTTHQDVTSNNGHLRPYDFGETSNTFATGSKPAQAQHCTNGDNFGIGGHLRVPSTPKHRHDSFHKSSISSDGEGDGDDDSLSEPWTPPDPGSRPLSRSQGIKASLGSLDWTSPTQWPTGTGLSSSSLVESWTTAGAIELSDSDEPNYDEVKPIVSLSTAQCFQHRVADIPGRRLLLVYTDLHQRRN